MAGAARGAPVQAAGQGNDADNIVPDPVVSAEEVGISREVGGGDRSVGHRPGAGLFL